MGTGGEKSSGQQRRFNPKRNYKKWLLDRLRRMSGQLGAAFPLALRAAPTGPITLQMTPPPADTNADNDMVSYYGGNRSDVKPGWRRAV